MKNILTPKVVIASLVIAGILLCASLVYILVTRPAAHAGAMSGPAAMTLIPGPTSTPPFVPPTLTPLPPTPVPTPTAASGQFAIGVYVQITGTGGDGLRLRSEPGLNSQQLFLGYDSEVFRIVKGPQRVDKYTWWYLTAPYDQTRSGWAAQDYLTVIQSP